MASRRRALGRNGRVAEPKDKPAWVPVLQQAIRRRDQLTLEVRQADDKLRALTAQQNRASGVVDGIMLGARITAEEAQKVLNA